MRSCVCIAVLLKLFCTFSPVAAESPFGLEAPVESCLDRQAEVCAVPSSRMNLYHMELSPPCQSVRLLAKTLNVPLNLIQLDLFKDEHLTPEFLKINPQHMVPTLVDGDFTLWESRAIMTYLYEKYATDDALYPRDPQKRALINQRLYFDMGTLYERFGLHYYPQAFEEKPVPEGTSKQFEEALQFLETFLGQTTYVAGEALSIADYAILTSITTFKVAAGVDLAKYANIERWFGLVSKSVPGHEEICVQGSKVFAPYFVNVKH
ncbi:glutathione S-transferase 4 [Culex quinquefasciatus]|uniref:glutathione S-transferase 4 n=1 Tax=Culex quinquefasciatus TaxID=7176 RepID=UPI0018E378A4|nr:glutathione S-transferase 4 [Culex quinquefasciatus]